MFIARQPIFNNSMRIYGYELLHRSSETATSFGGISSQQATARVLGSVFEIGVATITSNERAFINFDYDSLLSGSIELIDPEKLIIEVLEDVPVDDLIIDRLTYLKNLGYRIALDDFVEDYDEYPLVPMSDIIKYDILATPLNSIRDEVKFALGHGKTLLAEKVETKFQYEVAKQMGFTLFQGYFFSKPSIISKSNNKKSTKLNYIKLVKELEKEEPSYDVLSEIIQGDVNLAYRLLRVIKNNSDEDIAYSIKKSLIYMGFTQIERWINIIMLQELGLDKPMELTRLSLVRSKFGGLLALHSKFFSRDDEISTMFLFSTLDALLDSNMKESLDGLSVSYDIREALIYERGGLYPLVDLVFSYERGDWGKINELSLEIGIDKKKIAPYYIEALKYSKETLEIF